MEVTLKEKETAEGSPFVHCLSSHLPACSVDIIVGISASILGHKLAIERWSKELPGEWVPNFCAVTTPDLPTTRLLLSE